MYSWFSTTRLGRQLHELTTAGSMNSVDEALTSIQPYYSLAYQICGSLVVLAVVRWFAHAIQWRKRSRLWGGSLPRAPFSMWFGNIPAYAQVMPDCPQDCHPASSSTVMWRKFNLGAMYLLDSYPVFGYKQAIIVDPGLANHFTVTNNTIRHPAVKYVIGHIIGSKSMFLQNDKDWKRSRALFNPGFAPNHILTLTPAIVDQTLKFYNTLDQYAESGEVFQAEKVAASVTIDIIGQVVLDHDFKSQTTDNEFVRAFRSQVSWSPGGTLITMFKDMNPILPIAHWWYARKMDRYLEKVIEKRYAERSSQVHDGDLKKRGKPIVDLALDQYILEQKKEGNDASSGTDPEFKQTVIDQLKTFILAGHDTTSSTISYIFYMLHHHAEKLARLRAEFDDVFGQDSSLTPALIRDDPTLVNKLVYTNAIIKEVLRLFPAATAARLGGPSVTYNGETFETKDMLVWINGHTIHHRADLWPEPDKFIPERFLTGERRWAGQCDIDKDAWRAFEKGARSCIGQEFAMLELKIIMALTLRDFEFECGYEDWDLKMGREQPGAMLGGKRGMFGYRAYQVLEASAKPVDSMPLKVKKRMAETC